MGTVNTMCNVKIEEALLESNMLDNLKGTKSDCSAEALKLKCIIM